MKLIMYKDVNETDGTLEALQYLAITYRIAKETLCWMESLKVSELAENCKKLERAAFTMEFYKFCAEGSLEWADSVKNAGIMIKKGREQAHDEKRQAANPGAKDAAEAAQP